MPFRTRREERRLEQGASPPVLWGNKSVLPAANLTPIQIAFRIAESNSISEIHEILSTLMRSAASRANLNSHTLSAPVFPEHLIQARLAALARRIQPNVNRSCRLTAPPSSVSPLLTILRNLCHSCGLPENALVPHSPDEAARELAYLVDSSTREMMRLPMQVPADTAAEIGAKRGGRALARRRATQGPHFPNPRFGEKQINQLSLNQTAANLLDPSGSFLAAPEETAGAWRKGGNTLIIINCKSDKT